MAILFYKGLVCIFMINNESEQTKLNLRNVQSGTCFCKKQTDFTVKIVVSSPELYLIQT